MISAISFKVNLSLSIYASVAKITSFKLCGGMLVAYPDEIPLAPFTKRLGNLAGSTTGSNSSSSKLGTNGTVRLSISPSSASAALDNLASV